jgi:hypothetical protein
MSTPGRRRALRALGKARARNRNRVASGKKPVLTVNGKKKAVSLSTFNKRTGAGLTKRKAQARRRNARK